MISVDTIKSIVESKLSPKRFKHTIGVYKTAKELAKIYECNVYKASVAALLHDYAKKMSEVEMRQYVDRYNIAIDKVIDYQIDLAHGLIASEIAKNEINIHDTEILDAIKYHTIARENMTILDKIIYLADYIEPNRDFNGVEKIRDVSFKSIDKAMILALENSIKHVISKGKLLHPNTVLARNSILLKQK